MPYGLLLALALLLVGCAEPPAPEPESAAPSAPALVTKADSVAMQVVAASGGFDAWHALPALRFSFGVERGGEARVAARHLWDKQTGRYRVEWPGGADSTYTALFTAWPDSGRAYLNGEPLDGSAADVAMASARSRTLNDTYWLLAPFKLFDGGVARTYAPDSSDAATDVIRLDFDGVGLTPGDRYWLFVDKESGQLTRWTFVLEGSTTPRSSTWTAYRSLSSPQGRVVLSARKDVVGAPVTILTDELQAPAALDETWFTDPQPRL
ncbi:MAG: hypothetical protein AAGI91_02405 [Bacteroidota bacterium]